MKKVIFYLTDSGLSSFSDQQTTSQEFKWEDVDLIHEHLAMIPENAEVSLVLDVIDEDIYFEWVAKVFPWEKEAIKNRRLERLRSDDIALSEVRWTNTIKVSEEGRKEELMLSASVADSFQLKNFLATLEEAQVIVTAIYSKPFLLADYFKQKVRAYLKFNKQQLEHPFLMVSRQSEHTFRQTFFYEGQLRISRLIEIDKVQKDITTALINETRLAIAYVYNQQIVPFNSPIGLVFLDGDRTILNSMLDRCKDEALVPVTWEEDSFLFGAVVFQDVTPNSPHCNDVASQCYSPSAIVDFIFSESPNGFYQTDYVKQVRNLILGRHVFVILNVLILLAGMYYILISGIDTYISWEKQGMLTERIEQHQKEIIRLEDMVKLQDDAQQVKASVEFSESILKLKLDHLVPYDIQGLSEVFAKNNHIQLARLNWKILDRFDSRKNKIQLDAWVYPFYETYKKPVEWVDDFVVDLEMLESVESVELQKEPLNRELGQSLSITGNKTGTVEALPFTVILRVKDYEPK
ncbi:MAG: hypothetical protein ISEC1_P2006 [Thiomicrorhabdus sp.]|nr:MAG: hypothetical protein ISEC1_P2006 [Thiomicrorhabdus sp.]